MFQSIQTNQTSRPLRLGFVSSCLITIAITAPAAAQDNPALEVEEVVVSDIRSERSGVSTPASIIVITREEIEKSGAAHIADVLRGRGGVQVSELFGDGTSASVGIRGFGETANANTLVLVDGRRLNNNDIGNPNLNSIPLQDVERIEIIQGSAGTLFGDQAVGGVINIITRRPEKLRAGIGGKAGSYSRRGAHASLSQMLDNGIYYRLSAEGRESDNYRDHNSVDVRSLFAIGGYEYATGDIFAEFLHVDERVETPGALFADELAADRRQVVSEFVNDFANTETTAERIGIRQAITEWLSFEAEGTNRETESEFILSFRFAPADPTKINEQSRHLISLTPRLIAAYPTKYGEILLTLGHDLELFDYKIDSVVGIQINDQKIRGNYFQAVIPVHPQVSLTLGARDAKVENDLRNITTSSDTTLNVDDSEFLTELGISVRPTEQWRLFARRDENVRFVKVEEFLDPVPGAILKTQTGVSYELGVEWSNGVHDARVVVYRLELNNEIAALPGVGAFGFPANTNLDPTRRDGVIFGGGYQVTDRLRLSGVYSYIDARVVEGSLDGNRVPFVAKHNLRISADYDVTPKWRVYGEVQAISDRVFSGDFDRLFDTLPGYTVANLKTDYRYQNWTFEARVNNVLDKEYSDFGARASIFPPPTFSEVRLTSFFPAPKRNFWFTARLDFD